MDRNQRIKIAVYGYYGNNNIGDETFKICFRNLWPEIDFSLIKEIPQNINEAFHGIIFGAGDLLDQSIKNSNIIKIPIYLIGIGYNNIHETNKHLLQTANVIITRNQSPYLVASDICFSLPGETESKNGDSKIVSVFTNDFLTPRRNAQDWIKDSYNWYLTEFSSILDDLSKKGYTVRMIPMCCNPHVDDRKLAGTLISRMECRSSVQWILDPIKNYNQLKDLISESHSIISQRLHGGIFSYIAGVPCIMINHHDKMHQFSKSIELESSLNYYGFNKEIFFQHFDKTHYNNNRLSYLNETRQRWINLSSIVAKKFSS
jgi:polysaccharide pyruvyl transferase WcaK-like protein